MTFINTAYTNAKGTPVYTAANPAPDIHTDWQDEILRIALLFKITASLLMGQQEIHNIWYQRDVFTEWIDFQCQI